MVWGKYVVPGHGFIIWFAIQGRLATKQRLPSWGVVLDDLCCLCRDYPEIVEHLFFYYTFSSRVKESIIQKYGIRRERQRWRKEISWIAISCW